jgi:hypothetical protein
MRRLDQLREERDLSDDVVHPLRARQEKIGFVLPKSAPYLDVY